MDIPDAGMAEVLDIEHLALSDVRRDDVRILFAPGDLKTVRLGGSSPQRHISSHSRDTPIKQNSVIAYPITEEGAQVTRVCGWRQTKETPFFTVNAPNPNSGDPDALLTLCELLPSPFDGDDSIYLYNATSADINIKRLGKPQSFVVGRFGQIILEPGDWQMQLRDYGNITIKTMSLSEGKSEATTSKKTKDLLFQTPGPATRSLTKRPMPEDESGQAQLHTNKRQARQLNTPKFDRQIHMSLNTSLLLKSTQTFSIFRQSEALYRQQLELGDGQSLQYPGNKRGAQPYTLTRVSAVASLPATEVFVANHSVLGDKIIVKMYAFRNSQHSDGENTRVMTGARRWMQEYTTHGRMAHKSIVELLGADARYFTLFLKLIPGKDLSKYRDNAQICTINTEDGLRIWRQIGGALRFVHRQDIAHNDIKPGNILFDADKGATLCDFGLSTNSARSAAGGTPYYLPPEFILGATRGKPGDIWALGIVMLYVLKHTRLPDSRHEEIYWQIGELRTTARDAEGMSSSANQKMFRWLNEVREVKNSIPESEPYLSVLQGMLTTDKNERLSAAALVQHLKPKGSRPIPDYQDSVANPNAALTEEDTASSDAATSA